MPLVRVYIPHAGLGMEAKQGGTRVFRMFGEILEVGKISSQEIGILCFILLMHAIPLIAAFRAKHIDGKSIADCKCPSCTKYRKEWGSPEPNNSHCPFCGSTDLGFAREFRLNKDGTEDYATDCAGCNQIFYMSDYRKAKK